MLDDLLILPLHTVTRRYTSLQDGKMLEDLLPDAPTLFSSADTDHTKRTTFAEFLGLCIKVCRWSYSPSAHCSPLRLQLSRTIQLWTSIFG